ncbi:MAG: hypothetical protein JW384_01467 [Nitrosomonadaceae bacterium]|nr:hypothetical protein [Nitrosomonadaceae bacterium]
MEMPVQGTATATMIASILFILHAQRQASPDGESATGEPYSAGNGWHSNIFLAFLTTGPNAVHSPILFGGSSLIPS